MNQKQYLLSGAFWLTFTGFLTRIAGFFYKIFLSRTIGAAQIGLFGLTMPVYSFCMAFACGGIQTAVSRFTAEYYAKKDRRSALMLLLASLLISGGLAVLCSFLLYLNADLIALRFLLEVRCAELLQILAVSLPFCVIHSCLCGYFTGRKNIAPSAISQLLEQIFRIGCAFFYYAVFAGSGHKMDASVMALGQLLGELASAVYCLLYLFFNSKHGICAEYSDEAAKITSSGNTEHVNPAAPSSNNANGISAAPSDNSAKTRSKDAKYTFLHYRRMLGRSARLTLSVSVPLGLNRMLLGVLQGIEASLLPQKLQFFGHSSNEALSVYGTLTGMSLPLLLFPTAITGALGTLLLPSVSEARTLHHRKQISDTANACFYGSIVLGLLFFSAFFLFGKPIGNLLFESKLAGTYISHLAWICPFLYLNTTMTSIIHGLGKSTEVFLWNMAGFAIRLTAIAVFVPKIGIDAYLYGVICSQIFISVCTVVLLASSHTLTFQIPRLFLKSNR